MIDTLSAAVTVLHLSRQYAHTSADSQTDPAALSRSMHTLQAPAKLHRPVLERCPEASHRMNHLARLLLVCALFAATSIVRAGDKLDCHSGSYRLADGNLVNIVPSDDDTLRWQRFDGATGALHKTADDLWTSTYGWSDRADGIMVSFSACSAGQIRFGGVSGQRIALDVRETTFRSHGTVLAGRLVMPKGAGPVPIVVLLHGSEQASALSDYSLQTYFLQCMLPAEGVGAFVYDKRGTGKSGGHYTQDFSLLADDAVAALRTARELAGTRLGRMGYQGGARPDGWLRSQPTAHQLILSSCPSVWPSMSSTRIKKPSNCRCGIRATRPR
jgi:hypothetical protein